MKSIEEQIQELKEQRGAVILAHNYQIDEVQAIADFTGDSLELSRPEDVRVAPGQLPSTPPFIQEHSRCQLQADSPAALTYQGLGEMHRPNDHETSAFHHEIPRWVERKRQESTVSRGPR